MAITLKIVSTNVLRNIDGVAVREFIGSTEGGTECTVYVRAIRVETEADNGEFERGLIELAPLVIDDGK